ncbi:MAG TPA: SRPBCC domain-containing protein [Candidatus Baltobacteraceae bacterium]|nr:SRPBCC domain-containing protein [Candidatus Baltobacteraceae bacterium]
MPPRNESPADAADREIVISRVLDAPRELVWEAWTDPEQVVRWWGPNGFTTTNKRMDVRVGGVWEHVMHGPDGTDYPNKSVFKEVVKPERIVYSHGGGRPGDRGATFVCTWTFEVVEGNKTRLTIHQVYPSKEDRDRIVRDYGAIEGGKQTLGRLAELLAADGPGLEFRIERTFAAARELVWRAWTEPKLLARWWGPSAVTNPVCELDVRPGGLFRIVMRLADGVEYPVRGVFREVVKPARLVMTMDCSDHPADWHRMIDPGYQPGDNPAGELLQTVTFEDAGGQTKLTIRTRFASAAIREAMVKLGMHDGWSQSLDRLAVVAAKA